MRKFNVGDKARIVEVRPEHQYLLGRTVVVGSIGGLGQSDDDICVTSTQGRLLGFIKEQQLVKVNDQQ